MAATVRLADRHGQAYAHRVLGRALARVGRYDDAHTHYARSLVLFAGIDSASMASTHRLLAHLYDRQGRFADALQHALSALDLYETVDYPAGSRALNAVGWYRAMVGDYEQAVRYCERALVLEQEIGDRHGESASWDSLGLANHHLGRHDLAITSYRRSLHLRQELGDRSGEAAVLGHLGEIYLLANRPGAARQVWRQALPILDDLDHPDAAHVRERLATVDQASHTIGPVAGHLRDAG